MTRKTTLLAATGLVSLFLIGEAAASGFQLREQSGTGQGTSYAGMTAGGEDISAMFFNPAAMGLRRYRDNAVLGTAAFIAPTAKFKDGTATRSTGAAIGGAASHGDSGKDATLPAFYALWRIDDDLRFGFSANVPFGLETEYASDWIGRYHATQSAIRTLAISPSASYQVAPGLVVGASAVFQHIQAKLGKAANVNQISSGTIAGDAYSLLEASDSVGIGGKFGVLWESPNGSTRMGLAYHSEIRHQLQGEAVFTGAGTASLGTLLRDSGIKANVALPETASFGLSQDFGPLTLAAEAAWTRWSKVQELRIRFVTGRADDVTPLKWKDTYFLSVGAIYRLAQTGWTFRTGVAFDKSPVPDADRTPRLPDQDRTWLSLGASYKWSEALEFDAGYSHIFVKQARLNLVDSGASTDVNRFRGNLTGNYEASIDILAVQARLRF